MKIEIDLTRPLAFSCRIIDKIVPYLLLATFAALMFDVFALLCDSIQADAWREVATGRIPEGMK